MEEIRRKISNIEFDLRMAREAYQKKWSHQRTAEDKEQIKQMIKELKRLRTR